MADQIPRHALERMVEQMQRERDELLECLEEILSADPDMPSYEGTLARCEEAIRKAKGEET